MKRSLRLLKSSSALLCLFLITLFSTQTRAKTTTTFGASNWGVSYNYCGGYIETNILYFDKNGTNDMMRWVNLYYKNSAGNRVHIFQWNEAPIAGQDGSDNTDGEDFYYKFINGAVMTWNWSYVGGNSDLVEMKLRWSNLPAELYGTNVEMSIDGSWLGGGSDDDVSIDNWKNNVFATQMGTPTNLTATTDTHCDKVALTWTDPTMSCIGGSWTTQVYRDNTYIGQSTNGTYNDFGATKGVSHNYKVRTVLYPNGYTSNASTFTINTAGRRKGAYVAPSGLSATSNRCDGIIRIEWQWNLQNPESFAFHRSTNPSFPAGYYQQLNINGDRRFFEDEVPAKNMTYYYRIVSQNNCGDYSVVSSSATGFAPDVPTAPSNLAIVSNPNNIRITWNDNSNNETGFIVKRSLLGGGGVTTTNLGVGVTFFEDVSVINCQTYIYEVLAKNACAPDGISANQTVSAKLIPVLSNTFVQGALKVSKGYFPSSVRLSWTNNNQNQLNTFKIYRRNLGDINPAVLIATINSNSALYTDNTADAGVMYEYFIEAEGVCENTIIVSNRISDIGFRSPAGVVNGHISYTGGIAVEGVRVIAEKSSGASGTSMALDNGDKIEAEHSTKLMPVNTMTASAWVKPSSLAANMTILSKSSGANGYGIDYIASSNKTRFWINGSGGTSIAEFVGALSTANYTNITGSFDGASVQLFVNGELKHSVPVIGIVNGNTDKFYIGSTAGTSNYFNGNIDEVSVWNVARTSTQIQRDFSRILTGNETGLMAYWRMDESVGNFLFDASYANNVYNENHITVTGGQWSTVIPSSAQLGLAGITNASGDYTISNIRYANSGEPFTITPVFLTHTFNPSNRLLYIGDGSAVLNNQDFTDNSSFRVTGSVRFKNSTCFVKDALLKIDGNIVVSNGEPVKTLTDGSFDIQVPIGNHRISVEMAGHTFEQGVFPLGGGTFNFQSPQTGIEFIDSTLIIVKGRVVGGLREGDKPVGMNRSVNNIGRARLHFKSQLGGGCSSVSAITDPVTGEYTVKLLPLKYEVDTVKVPSNLTITFPNRDLLDLSQNPALQKIYDTVYYQGTNVYSHRDSAIYHVKQNYIYRVVPEMTVTNPTVTAPFTGDATYKYVHPVTSAETLIPLSGDPFGYPVFTSEKEYQTRISVFEKFTNYDNNAIDKVPVKDGKITINNNIAGTNAEVIQLTKGDTLYKFKAGQPNTLTIPSGSGPDYSFTKTLNVQVEVGINSISWQPLATGDKYFRGYIIGGKSKGNAFTSKGPAIVENILRDPPGSNSFAAVENNTTTTTFSSWEVNEGASVAFEKNVMIGTKFSVGLGLVTPTEVKNNLSFGTTVETSVTESGEFKETTTYSTGFQTSGDPTGVGANADLFIGKAQSIIFGATDNIRILPEASCSLQGIECIGDPFNGFRIGKNSGIFVIPGGPETMFMYDQEHIKNRLITDLVRLRNKFFVTDPAKYVSKIPSSHANYGLNNDDPKWGTAVSSNDPAVTSEPADYNGSSYTFTPGAGNAGSLDSIRFYNQQIRLWQEALARNEREKLQAQHVINRAFSSGGNITYSETVETEETTSVQWEIGLEEDIKLVLGADVGGTGFEVENHLKFNVKGGKTTGSTTTQSTTYSYSLGDPNSGDSYLVDIKKSGSGTGPIFSTIAARTSCPFEDQVLTEFYMPGTQLSAASTQREKPVLSINPSIKEAIPSDQAATFRLTLGNDSEDDMTYYLKVLEESNPDGAIIEVDGATPNRGFQVLAGSAVNKVLTVKKGTVANEYSNIKVVFQSGCDAIADTVTFTVKFIPSCSPIAFIQPEEKWVLNNSFHDTLPVVIGGYDINYESLKSIKFQYKASADPSWINLETFYKDTTGMNSPNAKTIPKTTIYTLSPWDLSQLVDADYDIRAVASCALADVYSKTFTGHVDRLNPRPFGEPEPIDKVLDANDQISIQFNEPIAEGKLSLANFDIRGVLNGTDLQHGASSYFDGDANHSMTVADGLNLSRSSFTVEFWAKRGRTGQEEVVFSQGKTKEEALYIGFNAANQLKLTVADESVVSTFTTTDTDWHHYAATYDANSTNVLLIKDVSATSKTVQNSFLAVYQGNGEIKVGRSSFTPALPFKGNVHELRVWRQARTESQLAVSVNKMLSGREVGLVANWRMDEAHGAYAKDNARSRHAYTTASWSVEPGGKSFHFDGTDDNLEISAGTLAFSTEMDFTVEFWFKSNNGTNITLFSNGKGNGEDTNPNGWSIGTDANSKIIVNNNSKSFTATDSNFFDNQWHHFALTVSRLGQTSAFIDGNRQSNRPSADIGWAGFGGAKLWVGARGWYQGSTVQKDKYFNGKMDEVRVWSSARQQDQLQRDMSSRLYGDEFGLQAYYPFETYKEIMGINMLIDTLEDQSPNNNVAVNLNGAGFDAETPTIKLKRPVRKVNFKTTVNTDKIIFTIQDPSGTVENCILDITVRDVQDLSGNKMQSPATWSAYINKNQVRWQDEEKIFTKEIGAAYTFSTRIVNTGGNQYDFTIGNMPSWLTADITTGQIPPQSSMLITFKVDPGVNIGQYNQDLYLTTSFGFDEVFALNMKVFKTPPTWIVDKSKFQHSMNIYGQLKIGTIFSTDENDILAAFVNGECRGVAHVAYTGKLLDLYEAYITVYSNEFLGENVTFQIWKANEGKIYSRVTPNIAFEKDKLVGTPSVPQIFSAANYVIQDIPLNAGWNWVSFNLVTPDLASVTTTMASIEAKVGDLIKGNEFYDQFSTPAQWKGSLTNSGGIKNEEMYKIKLQQADTIAMQGSNPDPSTLPITIHTGWNWIGFISQKNIFLTDALGNFNASHGDLIKSQYNFSVYDRTAGWIGSLTSLKPGEGYMYKASTAGSFAYPRPSFSNLREESTDPELSKGNWNINRSEYANTMSLIAKVQLPEGQSDSEDHVLAAFINGTCRGIATPTTNASLKELSYFLTVYSNEENEKVEFKWLSNADGKTYSVNEELIFTNNNYKGGLSDPYLLTLGEGAADAVSIYPNPIGQAANITLQLAKAGTVSIEVYDLMGNKIDLVFQGNTNAGFANYVWNSSNYPSGIYFIKVDTGSQVVNYKVVK